MFLWTEQRRTPWDTGVHVHHWRPQTGRDGRIVWMICETCGHVMHFAAARADWQLARQVRARG